MRARLIAAERVAEETSSFAFEVQAPFSFVAGQTCDFTIDNPPHQDAKGSTRTFSLASSPAESPRILIATRLTGSAFKRTLLEAAPGLEIGIDGPFGSFTLHKNSAKPALFFAGGIGITPFHSMIKDATDRRLPHRVTLFYFNRTAASAAFLPDLDTWQRENPNFRLLSTYGPLDAAAIKPRLAEAATAICYIAGPPGFVGAARGAVEGAGMDPDNVRTEEFSGY